MRLASSIFLASALAISSLVVACGDDEGGTSDADGDVDGDSNPGQGGDGSGSGGRNNTAGRSNTAGASNPSGGMTGNVTGSTPLGDIDTAAEAEAACERVAESVTPDEVEEFVSSLCAFNGIFAEALGQGSCAEVQTQCIEDDETGMGASESCTPDDIPDCDTVTLDEYIACIDAMTQSFSGITCESDPESLMLETPEECEAPFAECPELSPQEETD